MTRGDGRQSLAQGPPSDKENRPRSTGITKRNQTQKMAPRSAKRARLSARDSNIQGSQRLAASQANRTDANQFYDPDQDEGERRQIRKGLRDLTRDLNDSRSEYLQAGNHGLRDTIKKANEIFENVKQTSDATIDSRLLVQAADLSYKKTAQLVLGDASAGIDVDEFVSKCISFMRRAPTESQASIPSSTQRRRTGIGRSQVDPNDSDEDQGDAMNWDWLGRAACFCSNSRPSVPGFLLGPLSVQKRIRQQPTRRARERIDPTRAVAPQTLEEKDLDRQETSNLTTMCAEINRLLARTQNQGQDAVNRQLSQLSEPPTDELVQEVMAKNNVADDGGIPLFQFCLNPKSFGQSVENLFYVSFLVRDGMVGVSVDSRGLATLHASKPHAPSEAQKKGVQKHQAICSLDFEVWQDLIEAYDIKDPIIPHLKMETGSLAVFSPVNLTQEVRDTIAGLGGSVKYIAALDLEHHIHLTAWKEAFPDAAIIAPEGLWEKRQSNPKVKDAAPFEHVFRKESNGQQKISGEFDTEFETEYVHSHPSRELVFYHRPSRTLIEADLLFNLPAREQYSKTKESATSGVFTKMVSPLMTASSPATWQKRFVWYVLSSGDRQAFAESIRRIDKWDFNRLIPCHGDVIESGAKGVFRTVMEWFLADRKQV
ncbi:putative nuclear protein Qri2/Nse4 [Aspergillus sclerotioniger CBS 115572]|uniref:Non-structural maintenance of chromosomes element 4 n=1 Tax=Aspergillus sclerotioniger CBS 115572 TaxID=1450535 RepID=A0A317XCY1_9EURO|nr:putative nuclear protein Qri2/Nse4 [Aspergillus sclerotioniger CBS 115572]PWY96476.1 putative nuclear protein Qri2/Nse4 [Aspergillus sclerotioniger CBS 115572]